MLRDSDYRDLCRVEDSSARSVFDADGDSKGVLGAVGVIATVSYTHLTLPTNSLV